MKKTLRHTLLASLLAFAMNTATADAHDHKHEPAKEQMNNYALVMGQNLPHLLRNVLEMGKDLGLTEAQQKAVDGIKQSIPPQMHAGFTQAKALELEIARSIVNDGATAKDLASKLDALQTLKRQLTDLQIGGLNSIKQLLTAEQYQKVLEAAHWGK